MTTTDRQDLDRSISAATQALLDCQRPDGEWCFELEADATIPSEYILFRHYLGEPVDSALEAKIAVYLRRTQSAQHGGWPLFQDGDFDMSASVKAYFALKMIGESVDAPHMARARLVSARGSTLTSPLSTVAATSPCSTSESAPFGPFTLTTWPSTLAVTPAGMATGFFPTRLMVF